VAIEQRPVDLLGPFADEAAARELSAFPELKAAAWAVIDASGAARTIAANALSKAGLL
jgi:rhodanese-related sulfurtransferase